MKTQLEDSREQGRATTFVRQYTVQVVPRTWLGRVVAAACAAALVFLAFFFFSFFLVVGAVVLALAVAIGLLKAVTGGASDSGGHVQRESPSVIDAERSLKDGVYRPRDSSPS
jgi:hypothetical protein